LDILNKQLPDVIILDVMMPMVDGFANIRTNKKDERLQQCKVIFYRQRIKKDIEKGLIRC
jgi:CheY-like chemotaxis protein